MISRPKDELVEEQSNEDSLKFLNFNNLKVSRMEASPHKSIIAQNVLKVLEEGKLYVIRNVDFNLEKSQEREEQPKKDQKRKDEKGKKNLSNIWKSSNHKGTFKALHSEIVSIYTFKQNNHSKGNLEKIGFCKSRDCLSRCKITLFGSSELNCELFYNQHNHLSICNIKQDIFKNANLLELCKLRLKPSEIIQNFNKEHEDSELYIEDIEENRKKISRLKYANKSEDEDSKICNIKELEHWFDKKCVSKLNHEDLTSLPWDNAVIADYEIRDNQFAAFITSKNLALNVVKQLSVERICIAADGTYKLNETGHPTIVIGLFDINRKFHLSKIYIFLFNYL